MSRQARGPWCTWDIWDAWLRAACSCRIQFCAASPAWPDATCTILRRSQESQWISVVCWCLLSIGVLCVLQCLASFFQLMFNSGCRTDRFVVEGTCPKISGRCTTATSPPLLSLETRHLARRDRKRTPHSDIAKPVLTDADRCWQCCHWIETYWSNLRYSCCSSESWVPVRYDRAVNDFRSQAWYLKDIERLKVLPVQYRRWTSHIIARYWWQKTIWIQYGKDTPRRAWTCMPLKKKN